MNGAGTLWIGVELTTTLNPAEVATRLAAAVPGAVQSAGDRFLVLDAERLVPAVRFLHDSPEFDLVFLANLTAVDWETHFDLIYQLQSLDLNHLLHCKTVATDHESPRLPSLYPIYKGALLQERELYDLMGIHFEGHPDLRRMLLWDGFPGHPLRKDFLGMPGGLKAGLPGFPYEPGHNAWPVPGSVPQGGALAPGGETSS